MSPLRCRSIRAQPRSHYAERVYGRMPIVSAARPGNARSRKSWIGMSHSFLSIALSSLIVRLYGEAAGLSR